MGNTFCMIHRHEGVAYRAAPLSSFFTRFHSVIFIVSAIDEYNPCR
jgi:hypothetical protein